MKKSDINVLIVEDDKSMRESLTEAVKRQGYKAVAVGKPDEAESIVKIKPIHALIIDVMLPGKNGVDLAVRLKENLIDGAAIVFMSGIYKDRSFAQDSIKKVEALEFYTKPFNTDELLRTIEKKLSDYIEAPKVDLHSLLATPFASQRERRKALDHVEELQGFDLPFVFCILMDSESSGHLNIVDNDQNIYGVTFAKGALAKVDSESTTLLAKKLLIQHGFITEMDLSELKSKGSAGDIVKALVEEGLMSPHVPSIIKLETITNELNKLVNEKSLKINFVPDRRIKEDKDNVDMAGFLKHFHDIVERLVPVDWLKNFYSAWYGHPISLGPQFAEMAQHLNLPLIKKIEPIIDLFKKEATIEEIISQATQIREEDLFKALHVMMLRRFVVFHESKRVKNLDDHVNRLKAMHAALKGKGAIQIFKYFGLSDNPKPADVARIYKEFAKAHHPDTLPQVVSNDVKTLNHELFSFVTAAHEVLSNEEKKQKYLGELKQKEAELQIRSDELVTTAAQSLSRGRYTEALPILEEAKNLYESERSLMHYWWAKFKIEGQMTPEYALDIFKRLRDMSQGTRNTALWIFLNGLYKRYGGDAEGAKTEFMKVLALEENFMDARRELAQIKAGQPQKLSKDDLLNADITTVVKNLFKKKGA